MFVFQTVFQKLFFIKKGDNCISKINWIILEKKWFNQNSLYAIEFYFSDYRYVYIIIYNI